MLGSDKIRGCRKNNQLGEHISFLTDIPPETLGNLSLAPCPPHLFNEIAATALPLGSISRPLCWQKKQQITFSWIVRLIIISRWQPMHYNAAEKRLTSFHIKIYNANAHCQLFVNVLSALIF